jgi:hypothetical protein
MSRIISPEMPAVVAVQPITSRSWQSSAKATRTISRFQQPNSSASEHPADVRVDRRHLAVVLTRPPAPGMAGEQQTVLLHQAIDALGVDGSSACSRRSAARRPDAGCRRRPHGSAARACASTILALDDVRPGYAQGCGDGLHGESSGASERDSKVGFLPAQDRALL